MMISHDCNTCKFSEIYNDIPRVWGCTELERLDRENGIVDMSQPPCGGELWVDGDDTDD